MAGIVDLAMLRQVAGCLEPLEAERTVVVPPLRVLVDGLLVLPQVHLYIRVGTGIQYLIKFIVALAWVNF